MPTAIRSRMRTASTSTETEPVTQQILPLGPAASQIAIKQLGTNGGGFFNVNSAHPFENPTPLSNFLEMLAILLIPAALCYTFGKMVGDTRQGWAVLAAMTIIFVALLCSCVCGRAERQPALCRAGRGSTASDLQPGGNMEGKEVALRHRQLGALGHGDDGGLERLGQRDARLVHAAGRAGADVDDAAGRGDLRRRRLRAVRHADLRDHRGVRRRPDGRAHAGVPGQEDRGV